MKVLIMAPGRCGSSVLAEALMERFNFTHYLGEPFNHDVEERPGWRPPEIDNLDWRNIKENTLVKCIINQWHIPKGLENNVEGCLDFFEEFTPQFDKVILLLRASHSQRLFSVLHGHQYGFKKGKYERQEIKLDDPRHDEYIDDYIKTENIIHQMYKKYPIIRYENLYNEDKQISKDEWLKIVDRETTFQFNEIYDKWFQPKHRKKVIKDAKI